MEITVISAEGLKNRSSMLFSNRIRPFISITTYPPPPFNADIKIQEYQTRVDEQGGVNPTWGDKFLVPLDPSFFANTYSCIDVQLFTKRLIMGSTQLGWFQIPVSDIFPLTGSVKYLSYRVRERDGTRGHGIVNIAIKLTGSQSVTNQIRPLGSVQNGSEPGRTVIGIPVNFFPKCEHLSMMGLRVFVSSFSI